MIEYVENCNLLEAQVEAISHCCNCFDKMGTGIALAIKTEYPKAYKVDCLYLEGQDNYNKLGQISLAHVMPENHKNKCIRYIYNIYGQYRYGREKRHLNYEAIYTGLERVRNSCIYNKIKSIGFPYKMGCMNAGGEWSIVESMIKFLFDNSGIMVYICKYDK